MLTNLLNSVLLLFLQNSRSPVFDTPVILGFIAGFVVGLIFASVIFMAFSTGQKSDSQVRQSGGNLALSEPETILAAASIKLCPKCSTTYTEQDLNYCLKDGSPLKVVGTMPNS